VRFPAPVTHYADVEAAIPTEGKASVEIFLPVWTPGSYLVREYARNLEDVRATGTAGKTLAIEKTRKNRWRIETAGELSITVRYKVYCREMTVRTNWVDENFALLNGAATFITIRDGLPREHDVQLELPAGWKLSISGMRETAPNSFAAPDYDTLVDSPILVGKPAVHEFEVAGKRHFLVNQGETTLWDGARAAKDAQKIVEQNLSMWGSLPYDKYVFLNLIVDSGGGLEHKNSFTAMTGRYATRTRRAYLGWLGLLSHEYFHAWNVKRLRPVELGPFDYENEVYTHNLWIAEGFTDYYTGLNVRRAGLATTAEYLGAGTTTELWNGSLSFLVNSLQNTPGRLTQPLASASYDAWIKLYRPDENSINTAISYYTKGGVIAWLLDARIRRATDGRKSLDDAMRLAWSRYSGIRGYTAQEFIAAMSETAGEGLTSWFHKALETTEELDYSEAMDWFGLEFKKADPPKADNRPKAWTGFQTRTVDGHVSISAIPRGTPAAQSGLAVDDEVLAVDDWRVFPEGWAQRLEQYAPRDTVEVLVSRRDHILRVPLTLGEEPGFKWQVQLNAKATPQQKQHLTAWLGAEPTASPAIASAPAR
jgi:predicted metalloprotease with PDZ domain